MINPGLPLLLRLGVRGTVRAWWRRLRTVKGALTALAITPFVLLVIASQVYVVGFAPASEVPRTSPESIRLYLPPLALFLLITEVLTGRALAFKPAELDFLFPAPVTRRELLAYRLLSRFPMRLLSGVWVALFTIRLSGHPLGGLLTPILLFAFIHVATELIALAGVAAAVRWGPWPGRLFWASAAGLVVWGAARAIQAAGGTLSGINAAMDTPGLRVATLPLQPFAELHTAQTAGGVLVWSGVALALIGLITWGVFAVDVAYNERAVAASQRALARLRRAGAGQASGVARPWKLRLRLPMPRVLGKGAPLAWRQSLELARNPRALVLPFIIPGLYVAFFLTMPMIDGTEVNSTLAAGAIGVSVMVPLLMPNIAFDFRRDVDRMATLRALPLRPAAVAAGQIFAPTTAFVAAQVCVVLAVSGVTRAISPLWAVAALGLGIPLTWAVVALDNLLFLWMPYRFSPDGQQNVQFAGKAMLALTIKVLVIMMMAAVAGVASYGAYAVTAASMPAAAAAAAITLAACCVPITWAVGTAFSGFDLAGDVPA